MKNRIFISVIALNTNDNTFCDFYYTFVTVKSTHQGVCYFEVKVFEFSNRWRVAHSCNLTHCPCTEKQMKTSLYTLRHKVEFKVAITIPVRNENFI